MPTGTPRPTWTCSHPAWQRTRYLATDGTTVERCDGHNLAGGWPLGRQERCQSWRIVPAHDLTPR